MTIVVINPNTSASMTGHLRRELELVKGPSTSLHVINPASGPVSIESAYDEAFAIPPTLELVKRAEVEGHDAVVLACFSDPGLEAARAVVSIPVVGLEESALHMAATLGSRFSILTSFATRVPSKIEHVHALGLGGRLASIRPLDMSVLDMDARPALAQRRILKQARLAASEDGAEVIVLGCAGLAGYASALEAALGVVVLDPSPIALKTAELMVALKLRHSKRGLYAPPRPKVFT
jgi:allantoin racemase